MSDGNLTSEYVEKAVRDAYLLGLKDGKASLSIPKIKSDSVTGYIFSQAKEQIIAGMRHEYEFGFDGFLPIVNEYTRAIDLIDLVLNSGEKK